MCWGDPGGWGGPAGDPGGSWRVLGGSRSCFGERAGELPDLFGPGGRITETLANSQRVPRRGNIFEIWCLACLGLPITVSGLGTMWDKIPMSPALRCLNMSRIRCILRTFWFLGICAPAGRSIRVRVGWGWVRRTKINGMRLEAKM